MQDEINDKMMEKKYFFNKMKEMDDIS